MDARFARSSIAIHVAGCRNRSDCRRPASRPHAAGSLPGTGFYTSRLSAPTFVNKLTTFANQWCNG
jgi:hypothetical protein